MRLETLQKRSILDPPIRLLIDGSESMLILLMLHYFFFLFMGYFTWFYSGCCGSCGEEQEKDIDKKIKRVFFVCFF